MDYKRNDDGNIEFLVKTHEEVTAIIQQLGAKGDFQEMIEDPCYVCHMKSSSGLLYFYAPDEQTRNDIWCQWHSEAKEAKRNWEESMNNQERASGKHEEEESWDRACSL